MEAVTAIPEPDRTPPDLDRMEDGIHVSRWVVGFYKENNMYCVVRCVGKGSWEMKMPDYGFEPMPGPDEWQDFTHTPS